MRFLALILGMMAAITMAAPTESLESLKARVSVLKPMTTGINDECQWLTKYEMVEQFVSDLTVSLKDYHCGRWLAEY